MTDDQKPLTGKEERLIRAIERVLAARSGRDQPGVKITNLASGVRQVEVHAYDDDLTVAGDRARAEFERQTGLTSVPAVELERLKWLASIGQVTLDKNGGEVPPEFGSSPAPGPHEPDETTKRMMAESLAFANEQNVRDIQAGPGRRRKSVATVGGLPEAEAVEATPSVEEMETMLAKLRQVNDSGVEGVEVSDA
jgi:hypothetical protein